MCKQTDENIDNGWNKIITKIKPNQLIEVYGTFYANINKSGVGYFPFNEDIMSSI